MADLPLLLFPAVRNVQPQTGNRFVPKYPHSPTRERQAQRLGEKFNTFATIFDNKKGELLELISGAEPEFVLVIETAGEINKFQQAVRSAGLEWLAEWDETIESNDDFYDVNTAGDRLERAFKGRLYLSMTNQQGISEVISLWDQWKKGEGLPYGKGKWATIFEHITDLRRWGVQEQLIETGIVDEWEQSLQEDPDQSIRFQVDLFYRQTGIRRKQNEQDLEHLIRELGGNLLSAFIDMEGISFHSVKAELPAASIRQIIDECRNGVLNIELLMFSGIMHYRPTGQALTSVPDDLIDNPQAPDSPVDNDPVVAILDGVPYIGHEWLRDRILLDDPDNLEAEYQVGERKHGTAMASLVIHGELDAGETPLSRPIYFHPILQVDPNNRWRSVQEYVPENVFYEDRIERAVRRMFEGEGEVPPQAPSVRIVNLSFGDPVREFSHAMSPCARLLDWLSWKYKILFCVSAGNYSASIDLEVNDEFVDLEENEKVRITLQSINKESAKRRLISPAESINSITVGSVHHDESIVEILGNRIDLLPFDGLPSPVNRLGYGFRRSVKPEIFLPGGKQLYSSPMLQADTKFNISDTGVPPGQKVVTEGSEGASSSTTYTRGTSNATALATRAAAKIYETIEQIRQINPEKILEEQVSILIKALLVHGASKGDAYPILEQHLKELSPPKKWKEFASKFLGYGEVDIERVLSCTEQRATVIGCGTLTQRQKHEYRFPLPPSLANENTWRRLTITLAWFSPINSNHRNFRQAALNFSPPNDDLLNLVRHEADHNQVKRGTVQHEILESKRVSDYQEGDYLVIPVQCRPDAIENLDEEIDYALVVTLEVKEGVAISIYNEVKVGIQAQIQV